MKTNITAVQLIDPLDDDKMRIGLQQLFRKKDLAKRTPDEKWKGADIHTVGDDGEGYVLLVADGDIVYFVRYRKVRGAGNKFGRQVLVWRDKNHPASTGFASHAFFEILLPKFGALITDQQQTQKGKDFWMYAVDRAVATPDMYVYIYDRRQHPNTLTKLSTVEELIAKTKYVWGRDEPFVLTHLVISKKPLKLRVDKTQQS